MLKQWVMGVVLLAAMAVLGTGMATAAEQAPRIGKDDVKARLGAADISIIDVRAATDWSESKLKIKGAVREDPGNVVKWASRYPKDRALVLYCA